MSSSKSDKDAESGFPRGACATIRRLMLPRDTNALGTIFGGIILSEIDLAAAIEAHKHHSGRLVTIAMDKVVFKSPVYVGDAVSFFTSTERVGTTSIRVVVKVWAERAFSDGEDVAVTEATVTMVAVDEDGNKIKVGTGPPMIPPGTKWKR